MIAVFSAMTGEKEKGVGVVCMCDVDVFSKIY
jgi:hypothetical protein